MNANDSSHHQTYNVLEVQINVVSPLQMVISIKSELVKLEIPQCYLALIDMPNLIKQRATSLHGVL